MAAVTYEGSIVAGRQVQGRFNSLHSREMHVEKDSEKLQPNDFYIKQVTNIFATKQ